MLVLWVAVGVFSSHRQSGPEKAVDLVEFPVDKTNTDESAAPAETEPTRGPVQYGILPDRRSRARVVHLEGLDTQLHAGPVEMDHPAIGVNDESVVETPYGNYAMGKEWIRAIGSKDGRVLVGITKDDLKTLHIFQRDTMNEVDGYQPWKEVTLVDEVTNVTFILDSYLVYVRSEKGHDRVIRIPEDMTAKDSVPEIVSESRFKRDPTGIEYRSSDNTVLVYHRAEE